MEKKMKAFCKVLNISDTDFMGKSRKTPLPHYRAVFCYLMSHDKSQSEIGRFMGLHPSSVHHHIKRIRELLSVNEKTTIEDVNKCKSIFLENKCS